MSLVIPNQHSCIDTWREAVRLVDKEHGHEAHNVLMTLDASNVQSDMADPRISVVDNYLRRHEKSIRAISNTIFPETLYRRHGAPDFFEVFRQKVLPTVAKGKAWSGYYFDRMTYWPNTPSENPLWELITRMRDPSVMSLNKFELALFDPARDLSRSVYGGQCLSFLSFKIIPGSQKTVALTAMYRNHYYIEKLLGNLIGLSQLLAFVASETNNIAGQLTVLSTHAKIDLMGSKLGGRDTRNDINRLLRSFDEFT